MVITANVTAAQQIENNLSTTNADSFTRSVQSYYTSHQGGANDAVVKRFLDALKKHHLKEAKNLVSSLDDETKKALAFGDSVKKQDTKSADSVKQAGLKIGVGKTPDANSAGGTSGESKTISPESRSKLLPACAINSGSNRGQQTGQSGLSGGSNGNSQNPGGSGVSPTSARSYESDNGDTEDYGGDFSRDGAEEYANFRGGDGDREQRWYAWADSVVGKYPYAWGGGGAYGPSLGTYDGGVADSYGDYNKEGFDCSGLAENGLFQVEGIIISKPSQSQYMAGIPISTPFAGCLGFPLSEFTAGGPQHVVIAIDDGLIVQASQSGTMISMDRVNFADYEWRRYVDIPEDDSSLVA